MRLVSLWPSVNSSRKHGTLSCCQVKTFLIGSRTVKVKPQQLEVLSTGMSRGWLTRQFGMPFLLKYLLLHSSIHGNVPLSGPHNMCHSKWLLMYTCWIQTSRALNLIDFVLENGVIIFIVLF